MVHLKLSVKSQRRLVLSVSEGGHSNGSAGKSSEAEPHFGMVFIYIYTRNGQAKLKRWWRKLWWFKAKTVSEKTKTNKQLWRCATEAFACRWKNLLVKTFLHRKLLNVFRDLMCSPFYARVTVLAASSAQAEGSAVPDPAAPTNSCRSNPALSGPVQQQLKWLLFHSGMVAVFPGSKQIDGWVHCEYNYKMANSAASTRWQLLHPVSFTV